MDKIIFLAVELGIAVAFFCLGKFVFPNIPKTAFEKLTTMSDWAAKFVVWAREFLKTSTGPEKMEMVVEKLKAIADRAGIDITKEELQAIAQTAYEAMKAGEKEAGTITQPLEAMTAAAPTVNIYTGGQKPADGTTAVATNNVPDGALETNEDGTVNVYNAAGEKIGTATPEEVEAAEKNVTRIMVEEDSE